MRMRFGGAHGKCCHGDGGVGLRGKSVITIRTTPKRSVNMMALANELIPLRVGGTGFGTSTRVGQVCQGTGPISVRGFGRTGSGRRTAVVHTHRVTLGLGLGVGVKSIRCRKSNGGTVFCCVTSRQMSFHRLVGMLTRTFQMHVRVGRVNTHRRTKHVNKVNPYKHRLYYTA